MIADKLGNVVDVTAVQVVGPYMLLVSFGDGLQRTISLERALQTRLNKGYFRQLQDADYFAQAYYDEEARTVAWPNGVDISPEALYADFDEVS